MSIVWNASGFENKVMKEAARRLAQCGAVSVAIAKENMHRLGHSAPPGQYPAIQTGTLRSNITYEIEAEHGKAVGRYGVLSREAGGKPLEYAYWLEVGTSRMRPRPWLSLSFQASIPKWKKILGIR